LPGLRDIAIFEVDHPDTQTAKRQALGRVLAALPKHIRFVAIDFNQRGLESVMRAGYRERARTFILWEGVTNYLTEGAVDTTLRWCARTSPGSLLLFTCVHRDVLTRPGAFIGTERLFASRKGRREPDLRHRTGRSAGVSGEPWPDPGGRRWRRGVSGALLQGRRAQDARA
jgi:methyltransferase (TIGR00027 family)